MVNSVNNNNSSMNSIGNNNYTVKSGDSLSAIAQSHGVSLSELIKANPQISNPNLIHAGQQVQIPGGGGSRSGNFDGIAVSHASSPSEKPAQMSAMSQGAASANLPSPYGNYSKEILAASQKYNIPPEIITGVISRETNGQNIIGDAGHGHGLMQIDDRSHGDFLRSHQNGLDPASNIDYGTSILRQNLDHFNGDYTKALAAYNAGIGGVQNAINNGRSPDSATTGGNYAADVLQRAQNFKQYFHGGAPSNGPSPSPAPSPAPAPSSNTDGISGNRGGYTVRSGDTLSAIAANHGVSLSALEAANPQISNPNLIYPGQNVNIPGGGGSSSSSRSGGSGGYTVQSGDNLSAIAARHGVSLSALEAANPQISNPNLIFAGQSINIPGGGGGVSGGNRGGGTTGTTTNNPAPSSGGNSDALSAARSILGMNIANAKYSGPLAQYLDKWPGNNVCCANFVSAALEKAGQISHGEHNDSVQGLATNLRNDRRWSETSLANAKPGDVVCFNVPGEGPMSHVVMFAGWNNGRPTFIGSNNVNSDGSQRITEGGMGYPVGAVFHFNG